MTNMNPLELLKFVQGSQRNETEQLKMLAALSDAPPEDYEATVRLPQQNELPAFQLGDGGVGSQLMGLDYGVPAPVPDSPQADNASIGQLLVGEL